MRAFLRTATALSLLFVPGCANPTGLSLATVQRYQARWLSHHFTKYTYVVETTGFFNSLSNHAIRLVILGNTVSSAVFLESGQAVPGPLTSFATIDGLFDEAVAAAGNGSLVSLQVDPEISYPVRIALSGPPDASGSILVSGFQVVP